MLNLSSEFQDKLNDNTERVIRTRVELYDTHFPVESNGFNFVVYEWTGDVSTAPNWSTEANLDRYFPDSDYGNLDNLMLSWGTGVPFDLPLNQFAIEFTGYFYVDADEALTHDYLYFYLAGEGITAQLLWGVGETELVAATELQTKKDGYTRGVTTFTSGTWQPIKIRIWGRNGYNDGGFVALYQYGPPNLGNMIFNPAFSAGISGWTGVSGVTAGLSTTYYYSSSPGLTISNGWGFARGTINNAIYKDNEYSLSFRMRNLYGATNQVRVRVSGCGEYQTISIPSGSSWVLEELTFTAIEDFTGDPFITLQPLYGSVAVDDFSLTLGEEQDYHKEDLSVLNAGIVNTTNAYLTAHVLRGVVEIAGTLIDNEPGEYSIILPYSSNGYVKDITNNWYEDSEDSDIVLREGKLIKIYSGYKLDSASDQDETEGYVDSDVEYIPRFTGFIENFEIDLKSNRLVVSCRDVLSLTDSSFCMNFPDAVSYWAAGYFRSDLDDQPNGVNMPAAYDRWQVVKAVKDLLLKSGISYSLLKGKEYRKDQDDAIVSTTPLIRNTTYLLDPGRNYGTDEEGEYNYSFGIGSRVFECVMKLIDTYGYRIAVRYDGCIRIQPTNNATDKQSPFSYLSQTGVVDTVNYKSQHGHYVSIPDNSSEVQYGFTGTGLAILFVRGETSGTADNNNEYWSGTDSVQVTLRQSGSSADYLIKQFNLYYSQTSGDDRFFRDGVDYELGDNPCYILIAQNLPYDSYYVDIEMLTNHSVGIEQLWVYNYNYTEIEKSLGTYLDSTNIGTIRDLKYSRGLDNYRNDILVAGRRLGVWTAAGESEDIADTIGRNPVYLNVHSRLIDIDSIYNPNAHNYTGRRQMTYIQEPSISTESRAQWLAYSVLSTYRTLNNHPQFVVWGDPQIQIGDCVSVYDKREEDGNTKMWIKGIDEKINSSSWEVACTVTSIEPYPSYEENQDMDIEEFADNYAINIEVGDTYGDEGNSRHSTNDASSVLATTVTPSSTSIILTDGSDFDTSGTVMLSHDSQPHYCVFTYTGKSTNTLTGAVYQYGTTTSYAASSYTVHQKYNPYESEDYDVKLRLTFTCLVKGRVRVGIKSEDHTGWIAGLSDNGGLEGETDVNPKWQDVWPGDDVPFIWGGVDQVGVTNDKQGFIAEDYSYYFEIIYEREFDQSSMTYSLNKVFSDKDGNDTDIRIIRTSLSNVDYAVVSINSFSGRNESLEYSQTSGDNGGGITYVGLGWVSYLSAYMTDNTNYIYTSSDGAISGELETYYIEGKRQYWVTAVHEVHRYTTRVDNSTNRTKINPSYEPHTNGNPIPLDSNKLVIGFGKNNSYAFSYNPSRGKWRAVLMPDNDFRNYLALDDYYGIGYWSVFRLFIKDASGRDIALISSSGSLDDEDLSAIVVDGTTYSPYMYYYADKKIWSRSYNKLERVYEDTPSINIEFYWIPEAINNSSYGLGDYFRQAPDFPSGSNHGFGYLLRGSYRGPRPNIGGVFFEPGNESIPLKLNYTKDWWT